MNPPNLGELVPDGIGGIMVTAGHTIAAINDHTFTMEARLTRVTPEGIQYDVLHDDSAIRLTAAGVAFVNDSTGGVETGVRAVDVADWTTIWSIMSPSLRPVTALPDGGVALFDWATNEITEYSATGVTGQSAAFDWYWGYLGNQTAFGLWTGGEGPAGGQLRARVSLPLEAAQGSFNSVSTGTGQHAAETPTRQSAIDEAAAVALDFVFEISRNIGREAGGRVCQYGSQFRRGLIEFGESGRFGFSPSNETCPDGGTTVGVFHTHWQAYATATMPSGYANFLEYHDQNGSDLKTADAYPTLRFYLKSHSLPVSSTHILRFQGPDSKSNIWERQSPGSWFKLANAPW